MQNARTTQLIFPIPALIATISAGITLQPGDIIATGTPAGVGSGFDPPRHLKPGDSVRIQIENVGELTNRVHQERGDRGFFYRWWQQQSEGMRQRVRALVHSGQLEFINGGWVMHDEAVCHYRDVLHHMSLGHRFLRRHFNTSPSIAWQIDPFGHSATQASLITAQGGLDAVFFARADHEDIARRKREGHTSCTRRAGRDRLSPR
ncbi:unnamed protein product [Closterium sp. NIES-53]